MALDLSGTESADFSQYPDYLLGADNHNIGNTKGGSWFNPTTWDVKFDNSGKFIAASILSGADSIYNSAVTVGNWLGAEAQLSNTQAWISSLDSDLGAYYSKNREAADLAGFIGSSFIPGIGGIKVLNAGQAALKSGKYLGFVGKNLSLYTNILAPSTETYVKLAGVELKSAQVSFSNLNSNTLKALGAGVWQNTLEGAAFETFVQASMFKSPILESQDNWDIAKNIAIGGVLGGVIGGSLEAAKTFGSLRKARSGEDLRMKPFNSREVVEPNTSPADRIILASENRDLTPLATADALPAGATGSDQAFYNAQLANAKAAITKKSKQVDNYNRTALHEMNAGAETERINAVADSLTGMTHEQSIKNLLGAVEITHPQVTTKLEAASLKDLDGNLYSRYIELAGENPGQVSFELPAVLSAADRLIPKIGVSIEDTIRAAVKEEGFSTKTLYDPLKTAKNKLDYRTAELRYIWADQLKELPANQLVHGNDIPLLERYLKDSNLDLRVQVTQGKKAKPTEVTFTSQRELKDFIISQKTNLADDMMAKRISSLDPETNPVETTTAAIARTLNINQKASEGTKNILNPDADMFAHQALTKQMQEVKIAKGLVSESSEIIPSYFQPKVAKINYKIDEMGNGNLLDGMTFIKSKQKLLHEESVRVVTKQVGNEIANRIEEISYEKLVRTNSQGAGSGLFTSAQGGYGSPEAIMQKVGGVTKDIKIAGRAEVDSSMQSVLYNLGNNPKAAIEFSTVNQKLSRTIEPYAFDLENVTGLGDAVLVAKKVIAAYKKAGDAGDVGNVKLQPGAEEFIRIENWETREALRAHQKLTEKWTTNSKERNATLGKLDQRDTDVVRAIPPSPKDYAHFAFVEDPRITGAGHSTMLFANTAKELEELVAKTNRDFPEYVVRTKSDTAEWFKAHQAYEYERGLNENYIDSSLHSQGIYSNFYTQTDPQKIVNDALQYHYKRADIEATDLMRLRHGAVFDWLENQAQSFSAFETSKFGGGKLETIAQNEKNPYLSYIKTALDLSSVPTSNPWWSANKLIDDIGSRAVGRIKELFNAAKSPADLEEVNKALAYYGSQTAFNSGAELALINHTAPKAEISKFVRAANAIMSRFTLGLDPLNSLNNAIGATVLRGTELTQLTRAINSGDTAIAGELAQLSRVKIPGVEDTILSPAKLIANSLSRFFGPEGKALIAEYKSAGIIRDRLQQFNAMADDFTLRGTETVAELQSRTSSAFAKAKDLADAGERLTGNKFAEEFNRFISTDVIRQITDLAERAGKFNRAESMTYWNTFVNRVEGNIIASQRPGLFQGPVGQAIGLFQSYQFNLLQQLFRYVAEGEKKDLGMLLGLQGTMYGLNGEPGFKFINDHVVGTLSGNTQHRDLYDITRGITGTEAGNWLLYGTASNLLQTNIYSRGDINPRQLTIIPTNIADVPFVGGMSKIFGTLFETSKKIGQGGAIWESIRQGIEHNGVSRPLAGLAQVASSIGNDGTVFSTSSKGSILGSNDLMHLSTLSRLAGGRPLDEAIQNDTMFSINSYEAGDRKKKQLLAQAVKTTVIGSNNPDDNEITRFAARYAELGGKQGSFAKYMMEQYTKANTSQAQLLSQKLNNPLSYKIQPLMGGDSE